MSLPPARIPPYSKVARTAGALVISANFIGAMLTYVYFALIAPLPVGEAAVNFENLAEVIPTIVGTIVLILIGGLSGRRTERFFPGWYERLHRGTPAAEVPQACRREVLNYPANSACISLVMWFVAGLTFGLFFSGSWRAFGGIFLVGGIFTSVLVFFSMELLWRRVIPLFFPAGDISGVPAFRLPVLRRLLLTFFLVSIYPVGVLVLISLDRARLLLSADNPETVLRNLFYAEVFVLIISAAASIGLALLVTRLITRPLGELQAAMTQVGENDFTVRVAPVANDELGYVTERFNVMVDGLQRGELLRNLLNLYVSPEVAREALARGAGLGGQVVECSVLFSDIRGFTSLSETLAPEALMDLLNRYMSRMVAVIVANGGMVNKFGGDSLLAVFGTPLNPAADHAAATVRTALAMKAALADFNREQVQAGGPHIRAGIGIATGPVVAGNIGGEGRIEYTVIGDTVNLASRLQDLTRELDRDILASAATVQAAAGDSSLAAEPLKPIPVRGKAGQVKIFALISEF
ncbi:MAG: HAMP domain-containing protein [Anaerolineales bacterium]|nr:HAMP domain-containing protein [Anaerolineales bacterium]